MPTDDRYFTALAAAFVRGRLMAESERSDEEWIELGKSNGLRLHKFKRNAELPRVRTALGILRGLAPTSLLDVGSGRGAFLWPLLDAFPRMAVTAIDVSAQRVRDIDAVRRGGRDQICALQMDATRMAFADRTFDVVTVLEVLEHMDEPALAAAEALRVARTAVIASVPSKEDGNPEHIHLFTPQTFEALWLRQGARRVKIEFVLNHMIAVAGV
jgi:ubiquinone/menaquinone biosynthesis C-methylase UbiE